MVNDTTAEPTAWSGRVSLLVKFPCRNCGGGYRGGVAIHRPFGEFRRAKSYCHLYGAQGQRQAYLLPHATMNFVGLDLTTLDRKGRPSSFQAKKCAVPDDVRLASGGNHMPKMVPTIDGVGNEAQKEKKRGPTASVQNVMYLCALEQASHLFMANNHH
ncbi:hypothetical protein TNCV_2250691 [Trichonephila clavipes]|nr:hypothetical protein TNCV_2250691 [Trichonephila clavipes]